MAMDSKRARFIAESLREFTDSLRGLLTPEQHQKYDEFTTGLSATPKP